MTHNVSLYRFLSISDTIYQFLSIFIECYRLSILSIEHMGKYVNYYVTVIIQGEMLLIAHKKSS